MSADGAIAKNEGVGGTGATFGLPHLASVPRRTQYAPKTIPKYAVQAPTSKERISSEPIFETIERTYAIVVTQKLMKRNVIVTDGWPAASLSQILLVEGISLRSTLSLGSLMANGN